MTKTARASALVNFNEQNNSLILILLITCLLTFIDTGLLKLGSRGRSLEMHVFTSLIFRRGGCGVHQVLFSDRVNLLAQLSWIPIFGIVVDSQ